MFNPVLGYWQLCLGEFVNNLSKTLQPRFEIFNDLTSKHVGIGQIVEIGEALVFQLENILARFVAGDLFRVLVHSLLKPVRN
jgi:hypothetical protein